MPFYLFARKIGGRWEFQLKLWYPNQVEFYSDLLLQKRDMLNCLDVNAPLIYSDVAVFTKLPTPTNPWSDLERFGIEAKLKELNANR